MSGPLSKIANEAIALATRHHWCVLPVNGKVPAQKHWPGRATSDPVAIEAFFREFPQANYGIATGKKSGILVIDTDPGKGGDESFRQLEAQYGPLPETVMALTGGGGDHRFFAYPAGAEIGNSSSQLGPGLDVKSDGGQVVGAGSVHPITGREYAWEVSHHPDDLPLAELPPAWIQLMVVPHTAPSSDHPEQIPDGKRNEILYRKARSLKRSRANLGQEAIRVALHAENRERCQPALSDGEVDKIAAHAWTQSDRRDFKPPAADAQPAPHAGDQPSDTVQRKSQATQLIELAAAHAEFFHAPDREPFVEMRCHDHREVWPIKTKFFRQWLAGLYFHETKGAVGGQAMQDALQVLSSMALFDGVERVVHLRLAEEQGDYYLDLANGRWQVVRITKDGWALVDAPPVAFRRPKSMQALLEPVRGGSVELLREILNVVDDSQWTLFLSWLLGALRPHGPYPILVLDGEHGTGKSTIAKAVKTVIDPSVAENRGAPRSIRDLMIAASNGWLLSFDNLSHISQDLSDGLCRLSTGGGLSTRELFSDADEIVFAATRPIILNAIGDVVVRPDLVDRSVIVTPPLIPRHSRREEKKLLAQLATIRPLVLGALLDAVVHGLRTVESVSLPTLPRMADFSIWVTACSPALGWSSERFIEAYETNRREAVEIGLEASPLVAPLRKLLDLGPRPWVGLMSDLLRQLTELAGDSSTKARDWPTQPNVLSNMLKRLAPALRETGLLVIFEKRTAKGRPLRLEQSESGRPPSSSSSPPSFPQHIRPLCDDDPKHGTGTKSPATYIPPVPAGSDAADVDQGIRLVDPMTIKGSELTRQQSLGNVDDDGSGDPRRLDSVGEDPLLIFEDEP